MKLYTTLLFIFIIFISSTKCLKAIKNKYPIIMIPGDGGNQIEAKLNKSNAVHYICAKKTDDYFSLWLNLELVVPVVIDCLVDNLRLEYDNITRLTRNPEGVHTRVPGFGDSSTVEWIDPSKALPGYYFHNIAQMLVDSFSYERGANLHGAPYDFRKAPNELQEYLKDLKQLIENTTQTSGMPTIILTHSMGGPLALTFLRQQTQKWKNKYIRALITLGAPWGGAVKSLKAFAVGDNLGSFVLSEGSLRDQQRTNPSTSWLLPSPLFWKPNETLIITPQRNYTFMQLNKFFDDISWPIGWEMRKDVMKYVNDHSAPGVPVYCGYGSNVDTIGALKYSEGKFPDGYPEFVLDTGDGTVNIRSLLGCLHWNPKNNQGFPVKPQNFPGLNHMETLRHGRVVQYIKDILSRELYNLI